MKDIKSDKRRIRLLILGNGKIIENHPGMEIIPYFENGQLSPVVWFGLKKNKGGFYGNPEKHGIEARINGTYVQEVIY